MLAKRPLQESASEALHFGADGIIITGRYTGDAPVIEDLKLVREHCPKATIIIGSGTTPENVNKFGKYANQAIIGTFFKPNGMINVEKIKLIMAANNSYEHLKETKTSE